MRSLSFNLTLVLISLSLLNTACIEDTFCLRPSGEIIERQIEVTSLSGVHLNTPGSLHLKQGTAPQLTIKAYENVFKSLDYRIEDGILVMDIEKCFQTFDMEIFLTIDQPLSEISVDGSGDVLTEDPLVSADELDLRMTGTGSIALETATDKLSSQISGTGTISISGESNYHYAKIIGTGNLQAFDFPTKDYLLKIAGAGSAEVAMNGGELDAEITGAGKIIYKGQTTEVNSKITGAGKVVKAD